MYWTLESDSQNVWSNACWKYAKKVFLGRGKSSLVYVCVNRFWKLTRTGVLLDLSLNEISESYDCLCGPSRRRYGSKKQFDRGGITPRMRRAFTIYLAGHSRPIHELLAPHPKDIRVEFECDFAGMTNREVTVEQLLGVLERLLRELPASISWQIGTRISLLGETLRTLWWNPRIAGSRKPAGNPVEAVKSAKTVQVKPH